MVVTSPVYLCERAGGRARVRVQERGEEDAAAAAAERAKGGGGRLGRGAFVLGGGEGWGEEGLWGSAARVCGFTTCRSLARSGRTRSQRAAQLRPVDPAEPSSLLCQEDIVELYEPMSGTREPVSSVSVYNLWGDGWQKWNKCSV